MIIKIEIEVHFRQQFLAKLFLAHCHQTIEFVPETETFKGNTNANDLLAGPAPRSGWEGFYEGI